MKRAALALLACLASAWADDGGAAPPDRWTHPRGPAAGNGVSLARPPDSFGGIAWSHKAKGRILAPPLTWDGAVFVLDGNPRQAALLALDGSSGELWARILVNKPGRAPQPAAFARSVYLLEGGTKLVQYQLRGRTLTRGWTYEAGAGASPPRILDGEIYVATKAALLSLRSGRPTPAWTVPGAFVGDLAVRGDHVYALRRDGGKLVLALYARADGKEVATTVVTDAAPAGQGGAIAVGGTIAAVELPPRGSGSWVLLSRKIEKDKPPELKAGRTEKLLSAPFLGKNIALGVTEKPHAVTVLRFSGKHARRPLVNIKERPDLFQGAEGCIWLGNSSQCFGTWCGDVNGNRIFWHVSERPEGAVFRDGVRFPAVPAGHDRVLLVPRNGRSLHAIVPERIR